MSIEQIQPNIITMTEGKSISTSRQRFICVPDFIYVLDMFSSTEKLILAYIFSFYRKGKSTFSSNEKIAGVANITVGHCKRIISRLSEEGYIRKEFRGERRYLVWNIKLTDEIMDTYDIERTEPVSEKALSIGKVDNSTDSVDKSVENNGNNPQGGCVNAPGGGASMHPHTYYNYKKDEKSIVACKSANKSKKYPPHRFSKPDPNENRPKPKLFITPKEAPESCSKDFALGCIKNIRSFLAGSENGSVIVHTDTCRMNC